MCGFNGGGAEGEAMPYENFIKRMVRGAARQSAEKPVCRGYPVVDDDFKRKIIYPRCRPRGSTRRATLTSRSRTDHASSRG